PGRFVRAVRARRRRTHQLFLRLSCFACMKHLSYFFISSFFSSCFSSFFSPVSWSFDPHGLSFRSAIGVLEQSFFSLLAMAPVKTGVADPLPGPLDNTSFMSDTFQADTLHE